MPLPLLLREIYCTVDTGSKLRVVLPAAELEKFLRALLRNFDALIETLTDVDVEQAESHDPADKRNILAVVGDGVGVHALNVAAAGGLRDGVALAAHEVRRRRGRTHARCAPSP